MGVFRKMVLMVLMVLVFGKMDRVRARKGVRVRVQGAECAGTGAGAGCGWCRCRECTVVWGLLFYCCFSLTVPVL